MTSSIPFPERTTGAKVRCREPGLRRFPAAAACPALLDHRMNTLKGEATDLCHHAGKVVLVVNTASYCGYTGSTRGSKRSISASRTGPRRARRAVPTTSGGRSRARTHRSPTSASAPTRSASRCWRRRWSPGRRRLPSIRGWRRRLPGARLELPQVPARARREGGGSYPSDISPEDARLAVPWKRRSPRHEQAVRAGPSAARRILYNKNEKGALLR